MQTTYTLAAEFGKSDGKSHRLRIKDFDFTKSAEEIKTSLTKLTKLKLFEKNGVELFQEVRRAKVIKRTERMIFEDGKVAENAAQPQTEQMAAVQTIEEPIQQVQAPDSKKIVQETIRIPEDLTITEEWPQPNCLIQTIELPRGYHSWDLNESQAFMLINACFPAGIEPMDIKADDESVPAKLIVTGKSLEEAPQESIVTAVNKESPPAKPKKKRKRLLERIRKRE
ncbi:DUF2922 family protein [Enterococcus raffinosus]|uniref:DUF2922 family protein n=1 Tax=Enterococcus raffinosus TaxID=71452 RepID=UPI001C11BFCA|nr:DUF2922 family protein [Enterococcus raffinosus]MBU5363560.1 DUF2922 family protein [Enterococcus raffinosus]